ncbi:hypothetical protein FRC01_014146, partial [Tulasnella sp. 417]
MSTPLLASTMISIAFVDAAFATMMHQGVVPSTSPVFDLDDVWADHFLAAALTATHWFDPATCLMPALFDPIVYGPLPHGISRQLIIARCAAGCGNYSVFSDTGSAVFVKRANPELREEAANQVYLYQQSLRSANAPCVPEVFEVFHDGHAGTYLVMEHVAKPSFKEWIHAAPDSQQRGEREEVAIRLIAMTVDWVMKCPLPEGVSFGPVGGGRMQHKFFGMEEAPIAFETTFAFEVYVNEALQRVPGRVKPSITLTDEDSFFCPSDVRLENFLWDGEKVWVVDLQHFNVVPRSLASWYFHGNPNRVVKAVADLIELEPSAQDKLTLLARAAGTVMRSGCPTWGRRPVSSKRPPSTADDDEDEDSLLEFASSKAKRPRFDGNPSTSTSNYKSSSTSSNGVAMASAAPADNAVFILNSKPTTATTATSHHMSLDGLDVEEFWETVQGPWELAGIPPPPPSHRTNAFFPVRAMPPLQVPALEHRGCTWDHIPVNKNLVDPETRAASECLSDADF